jgi:chromosome segregation ATPase
MLEDNNHENNVYAHDIKNQIKHISEVESGRKGYYCMGCKREMQAKKGSVNTHHFAHDPKDIIRKGKCTFSDETYRHKLAKDILQRIREIKVPSLLKLPPNGVEGKPNLIRNSWMINAHYVEIELQFYEDENGLVKYGRGINFEKPENKIQLLIQPDVAFFDENNKPILLIEIVATHKVNIEKALKIRRLGIDTIEITIPKSSPNEIEESFYKVDRTHWIYNYEQEQTNYVRVSERDNEGISPIDEFQRKLFESIESYSCRTSQINNLIRAIGKCLESEQYRGVKQSITEEIQRVENNTKANREQLHRLHNEIENELGKEFSSKTERVRNDFKSKAVRINKEQERIDEEESEFERNYNDLEERYKRKDKEIKDLQGNYESEFQGEIERLEQYLSKLGASGITLEERIRGIESEEISFTRSVEAITRQLEIDKEFEVAEITRTEDRISTLSKQYLDIENEIINGVNANESTIRKRFENLREESIRAITNRHSKSVSRIGREIEELLDEERHLISIASEISNLRRYRRAKEILNSRAWQNWI